MGARGQVKRNIWFGEVARCNVSGDVTRASRLLDKTDIGFRRLETAFCTTFLKLFGIRVLKTALICGCDVYTKF